MGADVRVAGPVGAPDGFCEIEGHEVSQIFVAPGARGGGTAEALLADAERRLAAKGIARGYLYCVPGNLRAARFYARCGWEDMGAEEMTPPSGGQILKMSCLRFEKDLPQK
jgi:GNAT superfamily N-acetyltransferase